MAEATIRVLVVDDHTAFRRGVAEALARHPDFRLVGEAADGVDAVERTRALVPDLIVMDLCMPRMDGLEALRRIQEELPCVRVVVLTAGDARCSLLEAVRSGAQAYVRKDVGPLELVRTLRAVARGAAPLSAAMAAELLAGLAAESAPPFPLPGLAPRDHEALRLVARGSGTPEIALRLGVVEDAVARFLENILRKLHLEHRLRSAASELLQDVSRAGQA